jgi:putative ABC transport system ATP-binding protein
MVTTDQQSFSSTPSPQGFVNLKNLEKTYRSAAGAFTALKDVNLSVESGEMVAVVGKSGSGKSTLLNLVAGIDRPTVGEVWINGTAIHTLTEDQIATWRGKNVGVVFQFFQLLPTLTIIENVMLPMDFCGTLPVRQREERANALLARVGVADQARKLPAALSGGQQQRVAIARALANDPPVLVADEPTGNLDTHNAIQVLELFKDLTSEGKTVMMVTHEPTIAQYSKRVIQIADGQIVNAASNPIEVSVMQEVDYATAD